MLSSGEDAFFILANSSVLNADRPIVDMLDHLDPK
jgi:hypothetical protein